MASVQWLDLLPRPQSGNYNLSAKYGIKRTEMSSGTARHRRVAKDLPDMFEVTWWLNEREFSLFEAFYNYDLEQGVKWFDMEHYVGAGLVEGEFRFANPMEPYSVTLVGGTHFQVKATLERRKRVLISLRRYNDILGRTDYDSILQGRIIVFGRDNNKFLTSDTEYWSLN